MKAVYRRIKRAIALLHDARREFEELHDSSDWKQSDILTNLRGGIHYLEHIAPKVKSLELEP